MNKFVLMIVWIVLLDEIVPKVPITKCCRGYYTSLTGECQDSGPEFAGGWPLYVYSHRNNQTVEPNADQIELNYNLTQCPDGYIAKIEQDFRLFEDGSLASASGTFNFKDFCVNRVLPSEGGTELVARFCVPDPCRNFSCIRKCCPAGMVVNDQDMACQFHPQQFEVLNTSPGDIFVLDGAGAPICPFGIFPYRADEFHVLPSGHLRIVSSNETIVRDYCIDTFLFGTVTVRRSHS